MRHPFLARLFAVLTCLALPLALAGGWAKAVALDTDRYVETVGPLAEDPTVQEAVADRIAAAATGALGARAPQAAQEAEEIVADQTARVLAGPEFAAAWQQANRSAHEELMAVLGDDPGQASGQATGQADGGAGGDRRVSLELGTALGTVLGLLAERGVVDASAVTDVQVSFDLVRTGDLERARELYRWIDALGLWLPVAWAGLLALTLLLGRSWRTLVWLGAGSLVSLGLLALTLVVGRDLALDRVGDRDRDVAGAVWDAVLASLWQLLAFAAGAAAVVLVLGWLSGLVTRRRTRAA